MNHDEEIAAGRGWDAARKRVVAAANVASCPEVLHAMLAAYRDAEAAASRNLAAGGPWIALHEPAKGERE